MSDEQMNSSTVAGRVWIGRLFALVVLVVLGFVGGISAGCNSPLTMQATSMRFVVEEDGKLEWSTVSTQSPYLWSQALTPVRLKIDSVQGPAVFIEAIQVSDGTTTKVYPLRHWISDSGQAAGGSGSEFVFTLPFVLNSFGITLEPPGDIPPGGPGTAPRLFGFSAGIMWKNTLGQTNFVKHGAGFEATCQCYPTDEDQPTFSTSADANTPLNAFHFNVTFATSGG